MDLITISCPHCGFSKEVGRESIPAEMKRIRCPKCREAFELDRAPQEEDDPFGFDFDAPIPMAEAEKPSDELNFDEPSISLATDDPPISMAGDDSISMDIDAPPPVSPAPMEETVDPEADQEQFCRSCGEQLPPRAEVCLGCGKLVAKPSPSGVNKTALVLITFFLGGIGGHRFYQKKYGLGVLYLLFCWSGIPGLVAFVEFIIYLCRSEDELRIRYPETSTTAVIVAAAVMFVGIALLGILAAIAIPQFMMYQQKASSTAAKEDLLGCYDQVLAFYRENQQYPTAPEQLQCQVSPNVALYYLSFNREEYQLVSFHNQGVQAYMVTNSDITPTETSLDEIVQEIGARYGYEFLQPDFYFLEE